MIEHSLLIGKSPDGEFLWLPGGEHVILQARSGAGKTVGGSIPAAFTWPGSIVVLDIKRELFQTTAGYRASLGHEVYLFDPAATDGRSHRWNPFFQVSRESPDRWDQISRMSFELFPEVTGHGNGNSDFWHAAGREAFCAVANLIAETPSETLTMANVLRAFIRTDAQTWMRRLVASRPYTRAVADGISGYLATDDKLGGSIQKTVSTKLQIWSGPRIAAATSATDFDLSEIRRKPTAIYIGVAPGDVPRNAPLLRLLFDALLSVNTSKTPAQDPSLRVPVLLLLDEFPQLGPVTRLSRALEYSRGFSLRFFLIVQNRPQVMDTYGPHAASSIWDNVGCEMIYGTGDEKLALQLEQRLGDQTTDVITDTAPRWFPWMKPARQTQAHHPHRRPLMLRQEVLQMPSDAMLILRPGMKPIKAQKILWYQEPAFLRRRMAPPVIPQLTVEIPMDDRAQVGRPALRLAVPPDIGEC